MKRKISASKTTAARSYSRPGTKTLFVRNLPANYAELLTQSAGARGVSYAEYVGRVLDLVTDMRKRADRGDTKVARLLATYDLGTRKT